MADSSADRDPLDRLAEEFVARFRRGERPSVTEYATRLPDRADEVRDLFPALVEMEQLKPVSGDHTGDFAPAAAPSDPQQLGEFRILRRVGIGGMGVVYEAVQESLGRHVALKLLPAEALADPQRLERFRREAKAAARLHHTNIVPVFGTGEADGRHYYAMQFISGHPLDAVIDEVRRLKANSGAPVVHVTRAASEVAAALMTGTFGAASRERERPEQSSGDSAPVAHAPGSPMSSGSLSDGGRHYWATVARVGAQVADALAYAHAQGILHRDVKPANLLLDLQGTVWVTDFGLAKSADADDLTHAGDVVGTLRYLAPERFEGAGDHRADIYALGLTLYELLTLKPAFHAENRAKLVQEVTAATPKPPRAINAAIPRDLETVVLKALQRDPAARYQSAAELAADLRRYVEDRPILARRATAFEQTWRWCRRNPAVAGLLAAVFGLLSVVAVVAVAAATRIEYARRDANRNASRATAATERESAALLASRRQVVRLHLGNAMRLYTAGDLDGAMLWYARAMAEDPDIAASEPNHRLRLGLALHEKLELVGLAAHDSPLVEAKADDAGLRVLTRTRSGKAGLWAIRDGRLVAALDHPGGATAIALSPDGRWAVTGGADGTARVWAGADGMRLRSINHGDAIRGLELKPGGQVFATAGGPPGVRFWSLADGNPVEPAPDAPGAYSVGFSRDAGRMVTADDNGFARVWEAATGKPLTPPLPHRSPDAYDRLWNVRRGPVLSPDGQLVITSVGKYGQGDYVVTAWSASDGRRVWSDDPNSEIVYSQVFDPDGTQFLGTLTGANLIDAQTGRTQGRIVTPRECQTAAFLAEGKVATISTGGLLQVWASIGNQSVRPANKSTAQAADSFRSLTALPDGRHLLAASADGTARLYAAVPAVGSPAPNPEWERRRIVRRGNRLVSLSPDGKCELEFQGGERPRVGPRGVSPLPVVLDCPDAARAYFSRDSRAVLTDNRSSVRVWDPGTGVPLGPSVPTGPRRKFSDDLRRIVESNVAKRTVRVIDLRTGAGVLDLSYPETEEVCGNLATFSGDGRWLATGDFAYAGAVEVWDLNVGRRVARFTPQRGNLNYLDLSADGSRLLVCSSDTTARLWDVRSGTPVGPSLSHLSYCRMGRLAADARQAVTMDSAGVAHLWDAVSGDHYGSWKVVKSSDKLLLTPDLWFADDGRALFFATSSGEQTVVIRPLAAPTDAIRPILELVAGRWIDSATEAVEPLPADTFLKDPDRYLRAFRAWKGRPADGR